MIGIIDYGSGNIAALMNIFRRCGIAHFRCTEPTMLDSADRFLLPGVGAFDPTMEQLSKSGILEALSEQALVKNKPVLGICVGMHLLAEASEEGQIPGLGWIKGKVRKIDTSCLDRPPHLPHMGWNSVHNCNSNSLFDGVDWEKGFYFLHSYYFDVANRENLVATTSYGRDLPCAVSNSLIHGVQFHPEKSHSNGERILLNFANLAPCSDPA